MRTSEELVEELHQHMKARRQMKARRKYRMIGSAAAAACLVLVVFIAIFVSQNPAGSSEAVTGSISGSIFAGQDAIGYVVVALAAFCLGVLITVFCVRLKKHMEEEERDDARSD